MKTGREAASKSTKDSRPLPVPINIQNIEIIVLEDEIYGSWYMVFTVVIDK